MSFLYTIIHGRMMKTLVVIGGPTASGKTGTAVMLAETLGTEVLSADSRQCYRELSVGTAKPTIAEMKGIPHHFIDSHSIRETVSAGDYARYAREVMQDVFRRHDWLVMTGGTGLYIRAALEGMDEMPPGDEALRDRLNRRPLEELQEEVRQRDPEYATRVDMNNPQRLVRALEVIMTTGRPFSSFHSGSRDELPYRIIRIALDMERERLYKRINDRVDHMVSEGLFSEALSLREWRNHYALRTVGYKEVYAWDDGELTKEEAIAAIKQNTRRYAKRQLTWFRKNGVYTWFHPENGPEIVQYVREKSHEGQS